MSKLTILSSTIMVISNFWISVCYAILYIYIVTWIIIIICNESTTYYVDIILGTIKAITIISQLSCVYLHKFMLVSARIGIRIGTHQYPRQLNWILEIARTHHYVIKSWTFRSVLEPSFAILNFKCSTSCR